MGDSDTETTESSDKESSARAMRNKRRGARKKDDTSSKSKKKPTPTDKTDKKKMKKVSKPKAAEDSDDSTEEEKVPDVVKSKKGGLPMNPKKKKATAPKISPSALNAKRSKNFSEEEDVLICKAYVRVSEDPVKGANQKSDVFWKAVYSNYNELKLSQEEEIPERNSQAIKNRFQRHIQKHANLYNGYYKQLKDKNPSGWKEDDYLCNTVIKFNEEEGRQFQFTNCMPILQKLLKFDPMMTDLTFDDDDELDSSNTNKIAGAMGANKPRPIGNKKAKKAKLETGSLASLETDKVASIAKLSEATSKLAETMERRQLHDTWLRMAQMYQSMGDFPMCQEYLKKVADDQAKFASSIAARDTQETPVVPTEVGGLEEDGKQPAVEENVSVTSSGHPRVPGESDESDSSDGREVLQDLSTAEQVGAIEDAYEDVAKTGV
jgi:hypothetical protein